MHLSYFFPSCSCSLSGLYISLSSGILKCKRKPELPWCHIHVYACDQAMRLEIHGRARSCKKSCQPHTAPDGTGMEQPPCSARLCWGDRRSAAAPQRPSKFHCCHLTRFCARQVSRQNRKRLQLLVCSANVTAVTPAIEYTSSMLCGIIYLGTVSNYSRSVLIFAILMV